MQTVESQEYIYHPTAHTLDMRTIDRSLGAAGDAQERLRLIQNLLVKEQDKDRFYVGESDPAKTSRDTFHLFKGWGRWSR